MPFSPRLEALEENPFLRLGRLLEGVQPRANVKPIVMSVGEPQHQPPPILAETVAANAHLWNQYPAIRGTPEFRASAGAWLKRRYSLPEGFFDADRQLIPVAGTKEAIFLMGPLAVPERKSGMRPAVLLPNPFYQVYAGAAGIGGAEPVYLDATAATGFLPDLDALDDALLARTAVFFLCTPANPQGAVADRAYLERALALARRHDFLLAVDECYSEIWDKAPPPGGLEAAAALGAGTENLVVFHSLSKRSNAAGLRIGFIAGDARVIDRFVHLRSYGGAQVPLPLQAAAAALWRDEAHVDENRSLYRRKFDIAETVLGGRYGFYRPDGGFFLWLKVGDGEAAAERLWREAAIRTLPGGYIAHGANGANPGKAYLRVALVHEDAVVAEALERMTRVL